MGKDLKKLLPALVIMSLCIYALEVGVQHWASSDTPAALSDEWEVVAGSGRGDRVRFERLQPAVVVLDFWASWCGPCRLSTPTVQALYEHYPEGDVLVYGVNTENRPASEIAALHREFGASFPSLHDPEQRLRESMGIQNLPGIVILGPDGAVVLREEGRPDLDSLKNTIDRLRQ